MAEVFVVFDDDGSIRCITAGRVLARDIYEAHGEAGGYDAYNVVQTEYEARERGLYPEPDEEAEPDEAPHQQDFGACAQCEAPTLRQDDDGHYMCLGCQAGEPPQNAP